MAKKTEATEDGRKVSQPRKEVGRDSLMVNSVEKAFRVLHAFDGSREEFALTEISEATGLDMSASQRFTHSLMRMGYLQKNLATKRFRLSAKGLEIGRNYLQSNPLVQLSMPYLLQLSRDTEESVNLTVLDGTDIIFVVRFLSRFVFNVDVVVGTRMPAFCSAPGRAILSTLPDEEMTAILDQTDFQNFTSRTPANAGATIELLKKAANDGYAMQCEEFFFGDLSVSAPVLNAAGYPIGAINIGGSLSRYTPEEFEKKFANAVLSAARTLSVSSRRQ